MYIGDISRLFECTVHGAAERNGMSHGYRRMLFHLAHGDGITQLELVKLTRLTAPTVSVALAKMEKEGLVKRVSDEKDMRKVKVYLTEKGREHDDFIKAKSHETEEKMLKGISEEEKEQLVCTLRKILTNMLEKESE